MYVCWQYRIQEERKVIWQMKEGVFLIVQKNKQCYYLSVVVVVLSKGGGDN